MPEILTDTLTRRLYANDASMYEEIPEGVAFPSSAEEIAELVRLSVDKQFSITARSGGTSLAGQTTGGGVIMDVSRYMTKIRNIDPVAKKARVEPGVIRDTLNREAGKYGLQFGPDTSTTNRCMIGGMIGNNSCGSFSIKHKTTREHIIEIEAALSDGSNALFKPLTGHELEIKCGQNDLEGDIYRGMLTLLRKHKERIIEAYPHPEIIRRNTGYALDRLSEMEPITEGGRPFNLAELLCGSEGTLALTASAELNLVPLPDYELLIIPQFESIHEAMLATIEAVKLDPAAVELVDDIILDATKGNIEQRKNRFFLQGDPKCILIIQFEGDHPGLLRDKARKLSAILKEKNLGYAHPIVAEDDKMRKVWELRKAGLGLLMGLGADSRSPTFVEDTAVRVRDLPDYVREFQQILDKHKTRCVFYAHASVGELHLRPVVDLTTDEGLRKMKAIAEEVSHLVSKYNGSLSGEHGDGRARAPYIEKVLGSEIMPLLQEVKRLWDPDHRFNPGKITDPKPIDSDLRFYPDYRVPDVPTVFNWRREDGFGQALEQCNGAGVCRKRAESGGTMCPSYHVTEKEKDTTRGRANLFRQIFVSQQTEAFGSGEIHEALELCLSCKACKSECPANVDMAKMKAEFLNGWNQENGIDAATRFFGEPERLYPLASKFAILSNFMLRRKGFRYLLQELIGVDARRILPLFAEKTFRDWFGNHRSRYQKGRSQKVILVVDTFTNYHEPEIAQSACRVLDRLGYDVIVPDIKATGRPHISRGMLERARKICEANLDILSPLVASGYPILGLEPSEILTLRDEYPDLCREEKLNTAQSVARSTLLWEEFLTGHFENHPDDLAYFHTGKIKIAVHGHCHTKALVGNGPLINLLEQCGFETEDLQTGCCGMAGSFGYEKDKYEISMQIGEISLFPKARKLDQNTVLCAPGFSCRHQIADGTKLQAFHPAQILDQYLI